MTATPEDSENTAGPENAATPKHDGSDLAALREEIEALQAIPHEEVVNPMPKKVEKREPTPHSTDAVGSEKWNEAADEETLDN
jgi:hypothetical protein